MNTASNKKNFYYITILILTLIAVIIGATFAAYTFLHSQKEGGSTVYTGTLSIEYESGNIINFHSLYPTKEPSFETEENVYKNTFKVNNTGTLDGILNVKLEIVKNQFSENTLQYILFNSIGEKITEGPVPLEDSIIIADNILLETGKSSEYTLIIWLEETGKSQNYDMNKELVGAIEANANQKRE